MLRIIMNNCVNMNHKDFKDLAEMSGLNPLDLALKMGVWMNNNNTTEWPTLEQLRLKSTASIVKPGVKDVFELTPKLAEIGNEYQYSMYINSIGIKEIAFHHSELDLESFTPRDFGYFQESLKNKGSYYESAKNVVFFVKKILKEEFMSKRKFVGAWGLKVNKVLVFKKSKNTPGSGIDEGVKEAIDNGYDAVDFGEIYDNKTRSEVIAIMNPLNAVKLGSKQDIDGFKNYINKQFAREDSIANEAKTFKAPIFKKWGAQFKGEKFGLKFILKDITGLSKNMSSLLNFLLKNVNGDVQFQIISREQITKKFGQKMANSRGFYDTDSNTIYLNSDSKNNLDNKDLLTTILHELVHNVSVSKIKAIQSELRRGVMKNSGVYTELQDLYNKLKPLLQDRFPEYFQDELGNDSLIEFIVALSDEKFTKALNALEEDKVSFFKKIVNWFKNLLGIKANTLHDRLMDALYQLSSITISEIDNVQLNKTFARVQNFDEFNETTKKILAESEDLSVQMIKDEDGSEVEGEVYEDVRSGKLYNRITYGAKSLLKAFVLKRFDGDVPQDKADRIWKNLDHEFKVNIEGASYTYDEYLSKLRDDFKFGTTRGRIMDHINQLINETDPIEQSRIKALIAKEAARGGVEESRYNWLFDDVLDHKGAKTGQQVYEKMYEQLGVNKFKKYVKAELRDRVTTQVTVASDILGYAGSIDMLVEHQENFYGSDGQIAGKYLSIYDLKSGKSQLNEIGMQLLHYGEQNKWITNGGLDMAKLQIAIYAMMIKLNNPEQRFKNLQVVSVQNKYEAMRFNKHTLVEVESFIPMMEAFFKDKGLMRELGLNPDIAAEMLRQSPDVFNYNHYQHVEFVQDEINTLEKINFKIALNEQIRRESNISNEEKYRLEKEMQELLKKKIMYEEDESTASEFLSQKKTPSTSFVARWLGGLGDSNHPLVKAFKSAWDRAYSKHTINMLAKGDEIKTAVDALRDDYKKRKTISEMIEGDNLTMYDELLKDDFVEGVGSVERLILEKDAEWSRLSDAQQNFIKLHEKMMKEYFVGKGAYLNTQASQDIRKKSVSHLQLQAPSFTYYEGFFPKTTPSDMDLKRRYGKGNALTGAILSFEYKKALLARKFSFAEEFMFENYGNERIALPIKYLGSRKNDNEKYYSHDLGASLTKFVEWLEYKKEMDPVYAMGKAINYTVLAETARLRNQDKDKEADKVLAEMDILKGFLRKGVQRISKDDTMWFGEFNIKITNPATGKPIFFAPEKFLRALSKWARDTTMWFKPFAAAGNTVQQQWLLNRKAIDDSWANKWFGDNNSQTDMSLKDMAFATEIFVGIGKDIMLGKLKDNKAWAMMEQFNYIDGNTMAALERRYHTMRERTSFDEAALIMHTMGEFYALTSTMFAQMNHMKLKDGRSFYEAYDYTDGKLTWTGGVRAKIKMGSGQYKDLTGLDSKEIARFKRIHERMLGNYRSDEFSGLELYAFGQFFVTLKKYFQRIVLNLVDSKTIDPLLGEYKPTGTMRDAGVEYDVVAWQGRHIEAKFTSAMRLFALPFWFFKGQYKDKMNALTFEQKRNMLEFAHTYIELAVLAILFSTFFSDVPDDDATKKWAKMYLIDNLAQQYNPVDILRTMSNLTPVGFTKSFRTMENMVLFSGSLMALGEGDMDRAFTQQGNLRGFIEIQKSIPGLAAYYDLTRKLDSIEFLNPDNETSNYMTQMFSEKGMIFR